MTIKFIGLFLLLNFSIAGKSQASKPDKIERNIFIQKINGYNIVYDCYNRRQTTTDKIIIYAVKSKLRIKLLSYDFNDNYIEDVTIENLLNHPFIYITSSHTHGHFYGELFALDLTQLKTQPVEQLPSRLKNNAPDSLEYRNHNGIRIEKDNKIIDGAYYSNNKLENYAVDFELRLIKISENRYVLKPIKQIVTNLDQ